MVLYIGIDFIVHAFIYVAFRNTIVKLSKKPKRTRTETHKKKNCFIICTIQGACLSTL